MKVKYNPEITLTATERQNIKDIIEYLDSHDICRHIECSCVHDCSPENCPFHSLDDDMEALKAKLERILDTTKEG